MDFKSARRNGGNESLLGLAGRSRPAAGKSSERRGRTVTSEDESIQALSQAVQSKAREDADQILADANAKADAVRQRGREKAAAERAKILEQAARDTERVRTQTIATTQMKARTMKLAHREKLLDSVFAEAERRLAGLEQRPDYDRILRRLLREALSHLEADEVRIRSDDRSRKHMTDSWLAGMAKETQVRLVLGPALDRGTGVIVETADGHRQYDNTLETRLQRMRDPLRSPVYKLLAGEEP
jgi:V/A-type H+-transporting ATPase subunit E